MDDFDMKRIGKAMKIARGRKGFSREGLARESGVGVNNLYNYESGRTEPRLYNLVVLADTLGVSLDTYIGRKVKT